MHIPTYDSKYNIIVVILIVKFRQHDQIEMCDESHNFESAPDSMQNFLKHHQDACQDAHIIGVMAVGGSLLSLYPICYFDTEMPSVAGLTDTFTTRYQGSNVQTVCPKGRSSG